MNRVNNGAFVAVISLLGASAALAGSMPGEQVQKTINLRAADATTPVGAAEIYRRISRTAREICGSTTYHGRSLAERRRVEGAQRCADAAIADAVRQVSSAAGVDLEYLAGVRRPDQVASASSEH